MGAQRRTSGLTLWLLWVLANAIGHLVGFVGGSILAWRVATLLAGVTGGLPGDSGVSLFFVFLPVWGTVYGASTGTAQWLVLRGYLSSVVSWIPITTAGAFVGLMVGSSVGAALSGTLVDKHDNEIGPVGLIVAWAILGAAVGTAQWLLLSSRLSRSGWWVLASAVGAVITVAAVLALFAGGTPGASSPTGSLYDPRLAWLLLLVAVAGPGPTTGIALVRLLPRLELQVEVGG